jgi:hypothetical protein
MAESLGRCIGIAGSPCGRKILDSDLGAVELERGMGIIGSCCYPKLFSAGSWGNQLGDVRYGRPSTSKPELPPGRKRAIRSDTGVAAKRKKRKQPWMMERD